MSALMKRKFRLDGRVAYEIIDAFSTTSATKSVVVPIRNVEAVFACIVGAAGTVYREVSRCLGTISATATAPITLPPYAGTLVSAALTVDTTITANDTNYWTFALTNMGQAAGGSTALLAATDPNTTKATGGTGLTGYVNRALALTGTTANLAFAASDVVKFTATKTSSAANLVLAELRMLVACGDIGEQLTVNNTVGGTAGADDAKIVGANGSTTLTVTRPSLNPTSGLKFSLFAMGK